MVSLQLDTPELAAKYDVVGTRQFSHGKLLVRDLDIKSGEHVLDVGAGTGLLAQHVASLVGARGKVLAIDPLPLRVELASQKSGIEARVGRAEDLRSLEPESFDVVYLNSVIHWIADKPRVLGEAYRVLKPGGRLGFTSATKDKPHDIERLRSRALATAGLSHRAEAAVGIPHALTTEETRRLLSDAGYRVKQVVVRTFVDHHASAEDVRLASLSSSFGNQSSGLTDAERQQLHAAFDAELENLRDADGIRLERHLIFAVAEKPTVS